MRRRARVTGFGMGLWRGIEAEQTYALLSHSDDPGIRIDRNRCFQQRGRCLKTADFANVPSTPCPCPSPRPLRISPLQYQSNLTNPFSRPDVTDTTTGSNGIAAISLAHLSDQALTPSACRWSDSKLLRCDPWRGRTYVMLPVEGSLLSCS